ECPDLVFTANAGLVVDGGRVIASRFRHPERRNEQPHFKQCFASQELEILEMPEDCIFEGEGDVLPAGDRWLAGYRFRSDIQSHQFLAETTGKEVLSLELVDEHWYHLDTALFVLDPVTAVYYPGAFDDYARKVIESNFDTLHVVEEEARRFACNSIVIGSTILIPDRCPSICRLLKRRNYSVISIPMSEFIKSGGACKCLVLYLGR
ncbi:MAG: arginine deiminase-related protein, partial [Planctomycetota bacterium]|nr:arginine deiminase-related protein [Planctomycetota bacterium]